MTLNNDNTATILGTVNLRTGTITATTAGALGNQTVTVGNTTPTSTGYLNDFSRLNYNAVNAIGAAGVDAADKRGRLRLIASPDK